MEAALRNVKVPVKLIAVHGGAHGPTLALKGKPHPDLSVVTARW